MNRSEFKKYAVGKIASAFPELAKYKGIVNIESEIRSAIKAPIIASQEDQKISRSLLNHFDKLIDDLKNTSSKKLLTPCGLCESEYLKPLDQQFEVFKAIKAFLTICVDRDKHGIRNAYVSFTRQRKQKIVKTEWNPEGARLGRPNIYQSEEYRYVVNRAAKLKKRRKGK